VTTVITAIHLVVCFFVILIVLLQHGKGADMGATFGGGSQTLFGAAGADNFLTKVTTGLAVIFMLTSVVLAAQKYELMAGRGAEGTIFKDLPTALPASPVAPAAAPVAAAATPPPTEAVSLTPAPPTQEAAPAPVAAPVAKK